MESTASHPRLSRQRLSSPPRCKSARSRCRPIQNRKRSLHRNQQYSITAITDASGTIVERYAYTAYGTPTISDASGTTRTTTAVGNRYTYTGREWDETLALYHYRARMYDSVAGRFLSRDPIGYVDGPSLYKRYFSLTSSDPSGLHDHPGVNPPYASHSPPTQNFCTDKKCPCSGRIEVPEYQMELTPSMVPGTQLVGASIRINFVSEECTCRIGYIQAVDVSVPWHGGLPGVVAGQPPISRPFIDPYNLFDDDPYYWDQTKLPPYEMQDKPRIHRKDANPNGHMLFETCVVCDGGAANQSVILGCISWGFDFTQDPLRDFLHPITFNSLPSTRFMETLAKDHPKYFLNTTPCFGEL